MEQSIENLQPSAPSLVLLGMRGAGKTTLGRLAAEHLDTHFIDADLLLQERHQLSPKEFVAQNGWNAFRQAETTILRELIEQMQNTDKPIVVSLGGGVVEEQVNRQLLKACWMGNDGVRMDKTKRIAVVHAFREVDKVLLDKRGLPEWTGMKNGDEVWQRRRPWFRECSSHEFVNFTDSGVLHSSTSSPNDSQIESSRAARLRFEAVERDFVRFLQLLLKSYCPSLHPFMPSVDERSYLVTLPFADLRPHVDKLPLITLGADAVELRADLLSDPMQEEKSDGVEPTEGYENPSLSYLSEQVGLIRRHLADYPLVFTLRTPAQGGRYPYPANAPTKALFTSLRHALKLGCDVIDIEMGLDPALTHSLIQDAKSRRITVLVSWRDKLPPAQGGFHWGTDRARRLYEEASALGADVVKMVGTAGKVSDNFALRIFAASIDEERQSTGKHLPVLSAYNMGYPGRISRFLNSTLASVTHPIVKELSTRGVVGNPSMTFEEVQQALHLSGLLEKRTFYMIKGSSRQVDNFAKWFNVTGLPFSVQTTALRLEQIRDLMRDNDPRQGDVRGVSLSSVAALNEVNLDKEGTRVLLDTHTRQSKTYDCVVILRESPLELQLNNKTAEALVDIISNSISPSIHLSRTSSCVILADANEEESLLVSSVKESVRHVGLGAIDVHGANNKGLSLRCTNPTIIVNCSKFTNTANQQLLANPEGGLYIDLFDNFAMQECVKQAKYKRAGWRCIDRKVFWQQVDALHFRAFTGRRAPTQT